jgi:hypothetical protein
MTRPVPKPPPLRCWGCGAPKRACLAVMRASLAFGDLTPATARCCTHCLHDPAGPVPSRGPWARNRRKRGRQMRAAYLAWRRGEDTGHRVAPQAVQRPERR